MSKQDVFTFQRGVGENDRIKGQLKTIVDRIEALSPVTRADLVADLEDGNKLNTKQPVTRVLAFYMKDLQEKGFATVEKVAGAEAEGEEAPAKPKKAKAKKAKAKKDAE